ncbi:ATP-binding protein [Actinomadura craniellae]|uniref:ATP-binding protein n=2 Tax=Actinomadura craniellae TaxID=2231787 RepID=A0A365H453_9ACTN|nr:ATP-binding protein [Actinomadura craniellae]
MGTPDLFRPDPAHLAAARPAEPCGLGHRVPGYAEGTAAFTLTPRPAAAKTARSLLTTALADWDLSALTSDVSLVVSELVANALLHGAPAVAMRWSIGLRLENRGRSLLCAITDASPRPPATGLPGLTSVSGRGLQLVAGFSDRWGWNLCPCGQGKDVWARFALPAPTT